MIAKVLEAYGLDDVLNAEQHGTGLINTTWKITAGDKSYILQRVNDKVFKEPLAISHNIGLVAEHLKKNHPDYLFIAPVVSKNGSDMIYVEGEGYFRLFPFVTGSHSVDIVRTAGEAFEAAAQFGKLTKLASGINSNELKITLPHFHDLSLRYNQFIEATEKGNKKRIAEAAELIESLKKCGDIVQDFEMIKANPAFKLRVTHHDTKISNVLFDANGKSLCVIDLDTLMPGYFISDVGDMMRTYLSPVSEEEKDFSKIEIREEFYKAIVKGYYQEMKDELTETEKQYFFYAGKFIIYMQALRFLTDYLNDDVYYGASYEGHNFIRATNQYVLLNKLLEKKISPM